MNIALDINSLGTYSITRARPLLGTMVEIAASGPDEALISRTVNDAFAAVTRVHRLMSYHDMASDVSRINSGAFYGEVKVHDWTYEVLVKAQTVSRISNGLFDITVAPQLSRLGFLPRVDGVPRIIGNSDWKNIECLPDNGIHLTGRVRIDLGGIAKGYAVDKAIDALRLAGVTAGFVNAGGDLRLFGPELKVIHVRKPADPTDLIPLTKTREGAVATSAAYFGGRKKRGRWVSPHIHPHTREIMTTRDSYTVQAGDCMTADALTKVVMADASLAMPVLEHFNARAWVVRQEHGTDDCQIFDSANADWVN